MVVDFTAVWCGPCQRIAPVVEDFASKVDAVFMKIDVDEDGTRDVVEYFEVKSMPTFVFLKNGVKIDEFSGATEELLRNTLQKHGVVFP